MSRKKGLLSIGELSKFTGASLRSLRYYEKLGILIPAFVDPGSSYRYYSLDQIRLVGMIQFCIELDIPLAEFSKFSLADDIIDFRAFLTRGREVAEHKMKALTRGLKLIATIEQQMDLTGSYQNGQIYTRELPEKCFHVKPCHGPLQEVDWFDILVSFSDVPYAEDDYQDLAEFGFLCEHTPAGVFYYAFAEVPKHMANEHTKTIPAGLYVCRQSENSEIEHTPDFLREYLADNRPYLAIETEIIIGKHTLSKPLHELRAIFL